jgi:hypothetical protein
VRNSNPSPSRAVPPAFKCLSKCTTAIISIVNLLTLSLWSRKVSILRAMSNDVDPLETPRGFHRKSMDGQMPSPIMVSAHLRNFPFRRLGRRDNSWTSLALHHRESVLFIGTQFSNLYTAVDTPAKGVASACLGILPVICAKRRREAEALLLIAKL